MAVTLTVQSDDGTVVGANAYISLAEFKAYHDNRGTTYSSDDEILKAAIVKATDYIDNRFRFRGVRLNASGQTTQCPRKAATHFHSCALLDSEGSFSFGCGFDSGETILLKDPDGQDISGIIQPLKNACAEYAIRASTALLFQDAPAPVGGIPIESITQKVDVIEKSVKYVIGGTPGGFAVPAYPTADLWLAHSGLIFSGNRLYR